MNHSALKVIGLAIIALCLCLASSTLRAADPLGLKPGENHIVFIGDSLVEQEQFRGGIEARLMCHYPDRQIVCRNLGWSGDDVRGNARTPGYNNPATFERLIKETTEQKPDVIFVGYGTFESFGGKAGLPQFVDGYNHLLDALTKLTPRIVLLSPAPQEDLGRPLPDPAAHNKDVEAYFAAIKGIADQRHLRFIDLYYPLADAMKAARAEHLTDNGIALNDAGYERVAREVERQLEFEPSSFVSELAAGDKHLSAAAHIDKVDPSDNQLKFQFTPEQLRPGGGKASKLKLTGLAGDWCVKLDGKEILTAPADRFAAGIELPAELDTDAYAKLRTVIVHRNEIFYRRWHPWNDHPRHFTYLEKDYPLYDQTIAELDKQIVALAQPAPHQVEIYPASLSDDPEAEKKLLELPEGLDIQLFASDPILRRPVSMNFDAQGRLWVLCIPRYPQILPGQEPTDYIEVLEDKAGTGHADTAHTFVTGLRVATGLMPDDDNGVYVGEGDLLLHFKDTKGSGVADQRRVIYSGFGTGDTHHTLNTFRWGNDGFLYFNQGWYINSSVETPWGPRRRFTGCIWQMRPESLRLEIYDRSISVNNTWGHIFDDWGQSVISSPWPADINLVLPDTPLNHESDDTHELTPPMNMTRIAGERLSGLERITGRHFPADWQNNLIAGGFNSQRVYRYRLEDDGQRIGATELPPLIVAHHSKFRPIDVKIGPDGAIYVLDWYNIIIQHNQVDFHDPRRDHEHGRIWRITYKNRPTALKVDLVHASIPELLEHLKDPEEWTRVQAKRLLSLRDHSQVANALAKWTAALDAKDPQAEHHRVEALWTYQTIDTPEPTLLGSLLKSGNPRARAAAITVAGYWQEHLSNLPDIIASAASDPNRLVRLSAVLTGQRVPSAEAAAAGLMALDQPVDDMLRFELHKLAVVLEPYWYPQVADGSFDFGKKLDHELFALEALPADRSMPQLTALLKADKVPHDRQADVLARVADAGSPQQRGVVLDMVIGAASFSTDDRSRLLEALVSSTPQRGKPETQLLDQLAPLAARQDALGVAALHAATVWKIESVRPELQKIITDPASTPPRRSAALAALVQLGGPATLEQLDHLTAANMPFDVRIDALAAMAAVDVRRSASATATLFHEKLPAGADPAPAFNAFLSRDGGKEALTEALKANKPDSDVAKLCLRQLYGAGVSEPALAESLGSGNAMTDRKARFSREEQQRYVQLALTSGDAARGEKIFRSSIGCTQCHAIAGAGGNVGPDLSVIGTTAQPDFLVEHLIIPTKSVKEGFAAVMVATKSGDALSGIKVRESDRELVLRDATHDQIVVAKDQIAKRRDIGTLMPTGIADGLTDNEFADLIRFLIELGKPGVYDAGHAPLARTWQVVTTAPADLAAASNDDRTLLVRLSDERVGWSTVFSSVSGQLPLDELPRSGLSMRVLRARFNVMTAGKLSLLVQGPPSLKLWVDGKLLEHGDALPLDLAAGPHLLIATADAGANPPLRCELEPAAGSPARAQWVNGR